MGGARRTATRTEGNEGERRREKRNPRITRKIRMAERSSTGKF